MAQASEVFIGRQNELKQLQQLLERKASSLVVIKGRRRIGKSRLAVEFGRRNPGYQTYYFTGLPPDSGLNEASEREEFASQIARQFSMPAPRSDNWNDLFWQLSDRLKGQKAILILDEINWLGSRDASFLGRLKSAWDRDFSQHSSLMIILSGSLTSWIERNILHSTGFVGRIDLDLSLGELSIQQSLKFWGARQDRISLYEQLKLLMITGGVPRYLEDIDPKMSAEDNIKRMCFTSSGLLFREFDNLFHDLFSRRSELYKSILMCLVDGSLDLKGLNESLGRDKSGTVSEYIDDLVKCGFVGRDYTWSLETHRESKLSKLRICDNYLRFYLKYIEPNRRRIEQFAVNQLPNQAGIMGLQFENLLLQNRALLWRAVGLNVDDIVYDNPFFQRRTQRRPGCQIDYLVQSRHATLYAFEFKFKQSPVGVGVAQEVEEKLQRLKRPKHLSLRPVLVHVNGITDSLRETDYFDFVLGMEELLRV